MEIRLTRARQVLSRQLTGDDEGRRITGYAAVYGEESLPLWGQAREVIAPGAFDNTDLSGCVCLFNHDSNLILGTVAGGTLSVWPDERGLAFACELPPTPTGEEVRALVQRGDLRGCSFGFWLAAADASWDDERLLRTIHRVRVVDDVGPVLWPAYPATGVEARTVQLDGVEDPFLSAPAADADAWRVALGLGGATR